MPAILFVSSISLYLALSFGVFRLIVRRSYRLHGRLRPLAVLMQGAVFFSWGGFTWADLPPRWPSNPIPPGLRAAGWLLLLAGLAALPALMLWFGLHRAAGWRVTSLVRSGPYSVTRNPQVLACFLAAVGYALLWPSPRSLGWLLALCAALHVMVLTEEEHLLRVFGRAYQEYCRRVPRYCIK